MDHDDTPFWLYLLGKTQIIVPSLTAAFQLYTLSVAVAYFIIGAFGCYLSVKAVKKLIKQPRPTGKIQKKSYGMPSTHSATIVYYATFICAACRHLPLHETLRFVSEKHLRLLVPLAALPWTLLVVISRVWLGHHTWAQVAVGAGYGSMFAAFWFAFWTLGGLHEYGRAIEDSFVTVSNFFRL